MIYNLLYLIKPLSLSTEIVAFDYRFLTIQNQFYLNNSKKLI